MLQITRKYQNKWEPRHEIGEYLDKIIGNYIENQSWRFGNMIAFNMIFLKNQTATFPILPRKTFYYVKICMVLFFNTLRGVKMSHMLNFIHSSRQLHV